MLGAETSRTSMKPTVVFITDYIECSLFTWNTLIFRMGVSMEGKWETKKKNRKEERRRDNADTLVFIRFIVYTVAIKCVKCHVSLWPFHIFTFVFFLCIDHVHLLHTFSLILFYYLYVYSFCECPVAANGGNFRMIHVDHDVICPDHFVRASEWANIQFQRIEMRVGLWECMFARSSFRYFTAIFFFKCIFWMVKTLKKYLSCKTKCSVYYASCFVWY